MLNPPSDCLQSAHGRDDVSPMWLPLPVHPQSKPFLPLEYSGLNWINVQCQFHVWHLLCLGVFQMPLFGVHSARMWVAEPLVLERHYSVVVPGTCSRIVCCPSNRVDILLISSDCAFISSACWRCKCNRTDTCVWWAISFSMISASNSSWPLRAWASAEFWRSEALLWASSSCIPCCCDILPHSLLDIAEG